MMLAAQQQAAVPVPSFPPPAFFPPQGVAPPPQPFFGGGMQDFQYQQQPGDQYQSSFNHHNNMTVFPPQFPQQPPVQYQAIPPRPQAFNQPRAAIKQQEPSLVIPLHRAPTPLTLRRPQEAQQQSWRSSPEGKAGHPTNNSMEKEQRVSSSVSSRGGLPPRFLRQREANNQQNIGPAQHQPKPPSMIEMQSGSLKKGAALPPPDASLGLLIFGTSNVQNHLQEKELASQLRIPIKLESAPKLDLFQEKVKLLDPTRDWLVLVHCLGNDARNIALKRKSDAEKASEADELANEFCDIIEQQILGAAAHISVLVSMLLPRCDFQEKPGMANPNNVRKVINVQITSRLYENPRVSLINSDKALEWGEDVSRLNLLMEGDGYHLTTYGFSLMLNTWREQITKKMKECNFKSSASFALKPESAKILPKADVGLKTVNGSSEKEETEVDEDDVEEPTPDDEDTVPDPFGSYTAPVEIVSPKTRTISTCSIEPKEDKEDLDDDALPNLEVVTPPQMAAANSNLESKMSAVALRESHHPKEETLGKVVHTTDEEDEFHDVDDGGFIEDNYCGGDVVIAPTELPSMLSMNPSSNSPLTSGHFMEDSYLPPNTNGLNLESRTTVELVYKSEHTVKIAGDFNSWTLQAMEKGDETHSWRLSLDLPVGQYQYRYQVDGAWVIDKEASTVPSKEEGITNNVILVSHDLD